MPDDETPRSGREELSEDIYRRFSTGGALRARLRRGLYGLFWFFAVHVTAAVKRTLDVALALVLLILLSPLWLPVMAAMAATGRVFERTPTLARWCVVFDRLAFAPRKGIGGALVRRLGLRQVPVLFNILRGDMSWVGPRPARPGELDPRERAVRRRYNVRPGVICLWWIRRRGNVDYDSEAEVDAQYVETHTLRGDLGIAFRALPAMLYGQGVATAPDVVGILGIPIDNMTMLDTLERLDAALDGRGVPLQVAFVNADCANTAWRDPEYMEVLRGSGLVLPDGIGLKIAGRLIGEDIRQNVNGTDLFPRLCEMLEAKGRSVYLLGAQPGVAEDVARWIEARYLGAAVAGCRDGYFTPEEEPEVVEAIAASGADVLLAAMGAPRQDVWIARHLPNTGVKVAMGVGGLFDFYSGRIRRAPSWMREIGLEWVYRLMQEPGRMWRRYLIGNGLFLCRVFKEKRRARATMAR